jgi:predicted Zn finger-like uncharacterized protein
MYTECPDCTTAFRVTADVLRQAAGKVRCGSCGHAFNALLYLSETRPRPRKADVESLPELRPEPMEPETREPVRQALSAAQSAALLKSLDQLAGDDVRLEDTGVEWRLLGQDDDEAHNDAAFGDGAIDVEEIDGDVIEFSFNGMAPHTDLADEFAADQLFADTNAPLDKALFRAPTESQVDEILDDAPTPVDEVLSASPGDVEAVEVFTDSGATEVEAEDVFASPETRPEDVLRFDDNTGLPDNFDVDSLAVPQPTAAQSSSTTLDTTSAQPAAVAFGEPEEWGDLLDEVEPLVAAAPATEREVFADTGMHVSMLAEPARDEIDSPHPTLAEELAALPDEVEDVADADEVPFDPVAAAGIDLSGIYGMPAESLGDDDPTGNALPEVAAEVPEDEVQPYEALSLAEEVPAEEAGANAPDFSSFEDEVALALAAESPFEELDALDDAVEAAAGPVAGEPHVAAAGPARPVAQGKAFPETTGELEFELEAARMLGADEPEFDPTRTIVPVPTEAEHTVNMLIDADLMRLALPDAEGMASTIALESRSSKRKPAAPDEGSTDLLAEQSESGTLFETIIMEGGFARTELEQQRLAAEAEARARSDSEALAAQEVARITALRTRKRRLRYGLIASIVALALLLAGQIVHQARAELATIPALGDAIAPVYRAVGAPIAPEWNVGGWRFEETRGSTDKSRASDGELPDLSPGEERLTIYSRLGNRSDTPLPYPLIIVALTDRFEEVIGSKVLGPADYLTGGVSESAFVQPGDTFNALVAVAAPADRAAGFKLNVCYRQDGGQLRCAIEDFR